MADEVKSSVAQQILAYKEDSKNAKQRRMKKNQDNFDSYNLNADWSHKKEGQSKEFLPKVQMAVEQLVSFLTQGLIDKNDWFALEFPTGFVPKTLTDKEWKKIVDHVLKQNQFDAFVQDSFKTGLLGSLMICALGGEYCEDLKYEVEADPSNPSAKKLKRVRKKYWKPKLNLIRQEDYYPDPTGRGLFEIIEDELDWYDLYELAKKYPNDYDLAAIEALSEGNETEQNYKKARENNQSMNDRSSRRMIRFLTAWGTILGQDGLPIMENSVCIISLSGQILRAPQKIEEWDGEAPLVNCPIVRIPHSVWHRAMMDAPTQANNAQNELYNLMVDGGMMSVFGIKQVRSNWLANPDEISDGIPPGKTLEMNNQAPPGAKVIERCDTGAVSPETINLFNIIDREFQNAAMTSDIRMGNLPQRQVKATEIVASNQTSTGMQTGFVKYVETNYIEKIIKKMTLKCASKLNEMNSNDLAAILGEDRYQVIKTFTNEEIFAEIANGAKFKVYGMTAMMARLEDYRKITTILQTVASNPQLMREFSLKYSFAKVLGEMMKGLNYDMSKIEASPEEQARAEQAYQHQVQVQQGTNGSSQIQQPQNGMNDRSASDQMQSQIQQNIPATQEGA